MICLASSRDKLEASSTISRLSRPLEFINLPHLQMNLICGVIVLPMILGLNFFGNKEKMKK